MQIFDQVFCVFILLMNLFFISTLARSERSNEACSLEDTVNITDGSRDGDNRIHNNVTYTKQYYDVYEEIYDKVQNKIVKTESHERGCLCSLRNCIHFCKSTNYSDYSEDYLNVTKILNGPLVVDLSEFHVFYGFNCPNSHHFSANDFHVVEFKVIKVLKA